MKFFTKFSCDKCDKKFAKEEELIHHQEIIHFQNTPYDCKECDQNFTSMEEMRNHLQKKHSYKKDRF